MSFFSSHFSPSCCKIEKTLKELGVAKKPQPDARALQEAEEIKARLERNPRGRDLLVQLLDLVDRYWNGSKSLHKHAKFKGDFLFTTSV